MKIIVPQISEISAVALFRLTNNGIKYDETYTLTVKGLKEALQGWPDEMPVMAEWEGLHVPIQAGDKIDIQDILQWRTDEPIAKCLILNVDEP